MSKKILSMMPADGWFAVFISGDLGEEVSRPLACWALVEELDSEDSEIIYRSIEGMCAWDFVDYCECASDFSHYDKPLKEIRETSMVV